jgi:selenocysteine lyase/cysteine desulfurase
VFTSSATDALNRILLGLELNEGEHVYISPFEHNAVTRPLNHLVKTKGIELHVLPFNKVTLLPDLEAIEREFGGCSPRLVVLTHASNVCGAVVPVEDICRLAKKHDALTAIDMSQTAGLLPLDLSSSLYDFAVFAGHKTLYAPFGVGGFFCDRNACLEPVFFGGNGINSVEQDMPSSIVPMEEVGSQNTYAIAGLKASTDWIQASGMESIRARELKACDRLLRLLENSGAQVLDGNMRCERIGVVSALFGGYSPDEIEMALGNFGVAVRSGIQCAPYAHRFLGTLPAGTVRFSVSSLTNDTDFDILQDALSIFSNS